MKRDEVIAGVVAVVALLLVGLTASWADEEPTFPTMPTTTSSRPAPPPFAGQPMFGPPPESEPVPGAQ